MASCYCSCILRKKIKKTQFEVMAGLWRYGDDTLEAPDLNDLFVLTH